MMKENVELSLNKDNTILEMTFYHIDANSSWVVRTTPECAMEFANMITRLCTPQAHGDSMNFEPVDVGQ